MEIWTLIIIIFIIAIIIFVVQSVTTISENRREIEASIQSSLSSDEQIIHKQTLGVDFLGEHPPFGSPSNNGGMVVTDKGIIFSNLAEKKIFKITYEDMVNVSTET